MIRIAPKQNVLIHLVKAFIVLLFLGFLYKRLFIDQSVVSLFSQLNWNLFGKNSHYLGFALILVFLNWSLETYRLQSLINNRIHRQLTWKQSLIAVLSGITLGVVSPARLGEYAGRLVGLKPEERSASLASTLMCSLALTIITTGFGLLAFFNINHSPLIDRYAYSITVSVVIILLIGIAVVVLFPTLIKVLSKFAFLGNDMNAKTYTPNLHIALPDANMPDTRPSSALIKLTKKEITQLMSLSLARYLVYSVQYVLVLYFFGAKASALTLLFHVSLIFLLQTIIPLPALMSIVARGSIAVMVLSLLELNELLILMAALTIWLVNLVIPAIVGLVIILRSKIDGTTQV